MLGPAAASASLCAATHISDTAPARDCAQGPVAYVNVEGAGACGFLPKQLGVEGGVSDVEIEDAAKRNGIVVRAMSRLYRSAPPRSALMLGFSGFPRPLIVPAAARLASLVARANSAPRRFA